MDFIYWITIASSTACPFTRYFHIYLFSKTSWIFWEIVCWENSFYLFFPQTALDIRIAIFGKTNNLHVALAHEDLAYALYVYEYSSGKFGEAR